MIKAILIDDEPLACALLQEMLLPHQQIEVLTVCHDGFDGLKKIQELKPDVIFLDIQMPKITGIEMLELIPHPPRVIFTTAYDEYAIKAFEVNALDYLLKPYSQDRLNLSIDKLQQDFGKGEQAIDFSHIATPESSNRIVVKDGSAIKIIPISEVMYIEAASDYVKITTKDKYYLKHGTMQHFEDTLPGSTFIRTHRSYLVNTEHIHRLELYEKGGHCIVLRNQSIVPVSKSGYSRLKSFFG